MSRPIVVVACMSGSSESWGPQQHPHRMALPCRWRSRPQHHNRTHALQPCAGALSEGDQVREYQTGVRPFEAAKMSWPSSNLSASPRRTFAAPAARRSDEAVPRRGSGSHGSTTTAHIATRGWLKPRCLALQPAGAIAYRRLAAAPLLPHADRRRIWPPPLYPCHRPF